MTTKDLPAWLPDLPSDWELVRARQMTSLIRRDPQPEDGVVTAFRDGQVTLRTNRRLNGFTEADKEIGYRGVRKGELVVHSMDAFAGAIGVSDDDGKMSPVVHIYRVTEDNPDYVAHTLRAAASAGYIQSLAKGIRERSTSFDRAALKNLVLPRPPRRTQDAIVEFLDRETAQIDSLIEEQRHLLELLELRRESAVRSILTGGETVGAATKEHPVLGLLPAHWKVVPARFVATIATGSEDSGNADPDGEYPFFVRGRQILKSRAAGFDGEAVMTPGDGQGGTGKVFHYFSGKFQAHQRVYVFHEFRNVVGRFFYYYLRAFLQPIALAGSNTVTMESLRRPLLASLPVPLPPLEEQADLLEELESLNGSIDRLSEATTASIELAVERRAALITAAVTGQIDVGSVS